MLRFLQFWKKRNSSGFILIGSLGLSRKRNCFTTTLYEESGKPGRHYIAILEGEIISKFEIIQVSGNIDLLEDRQRRRVNVGEFYIYGFVAEDKKTHYGTKAELEPYLLKRLYAQNVPSNAGIVISSFLEFHGTTQRYLDKIKKQRERLRFNFDTSQFINTHELGHNLRDSFLNEMFTRLGKLKHLVPTIGLDDIALFKKSILFYSKASCDINDILYDEDSGSNEIFGKFINLSDKLYLEMLYSKSTTQQEKIDGLLSDTIQNLKGKTVLDVGIKIEQELASIKENTALQEEEQQLLPSDEQPLRDLEEEIEKIKMKFK